MYCMKAYNLEPINKIENLINLTPLDEELSSISQNKSTGEETLLKNVHFWSELEKQSEKLNNSTLPRDFDWRNYKNKNWVLEAGDQDWPKCGSCYAWATTYMMASRRAWKQRDSSLLKEKISIQNVLDCSFYTHGCEGGYPELLAKYSEQFGVVLEKNYFPYSKTQNKCRKQSGKKLFFKQTHPFDKKQNEIKTTEMQMELMKNGPFAVYLLDDDNFSDHFNRFGSKLTELSYQSENVGIMQKYQNTGKPEYINHVVLLIGWKTKEIEFEGKKLNQSFWIVLNSYGRTWGSNKDGTAEVAMGINAYGIESWPVTVEYTGSNYPGFKVVLLLIVAGIAIFSRTLFVK